MRDWLERLKEHLTDEEMKRCLKFLTLPFIVILLIIVIVVADKPRDEENGKGAKNASETNVANGTAAGAETAAETEEEPESVTYVLSEAEAEITELMEKYFRARRSCDANALSEVYGGGLSGEMLETERQNMESDVRYYQYFENLACSTVPGFTEDSLVIYARYDVKFRQADTLAPSMAAFYAEKGADGSWYLAADISQEEMDYIASVNDSDVVQAVTGEVNSALRKALESDTNLLAVYYELTGKTVEDETAGQGEEGLGQADSEAIQGAGAERETQ